MSELMVTASFKGGMKVDAEADGHRVRMDYPIPPQDTSEGFTPLQLLLASLAGCAGNVVPLLLQRMRQPLEGLRMNVRAQRRVEHPTVLTEIAVEFVLQGPGLDPGRVELAIRQAEEQLCPVWDMIRKAAPIRTSFRIE
jgi:putative redox protein